MVASLLGGILNGSPLAAPVLIMMVFLLAILVRYGQRAGNLYMSEQSRKVRA